MAERNHQDATSGRRRDARSQRSTVMQSNPDESSAHSHDSGLFDSWSDGVRQKLRDWTTGEANRRESMKQTFQKSLEVFSSSLQQELLPEKAKHILEKFEQDSQATLRNFLKDCNEAQARQTSLMESTLQQGKEAWKEAWQSATRQMKEEYEQDALDMKTELQTISTNQRVKQGTSQYRPSQQDTGVDRLQELEFEMQLRGPKMDKTKLKEDRKNPVRRHDSSLSRMQMDSPAWLRRSLGPSLATPTAGPTLAPKDGSSDQNDDSTLRFLEALSPMVQSVLDSEADIMKTPFRDIEKQAIEAYEQKMTDMQRQLDEKDAEIAQLQVERQLAVSWQGGSGDVQTGTPGLLLTGTSTGRPALGTGNLFSNSMMATLHDEIHEAKDGVDSVAPTPTVPDSNVSHSKQLTLVDKPKEQPGAGNVDAAEKAKVAEEKPATDDTLKPSPETAAPVLEISAEGKFVVNLDPVWSRPRGFVMRQLEPWQQIWHMFTFFGKVGYLYIQHSGARIKRGDFDMLTQGLALPPDAQAKVRVPSTGSLHLIIYQAFCYFALMMYLSCYRERQIWLSANGLTREYMLEIAQCDRSWARWLDSLQISPIGLIVGLLGAFVDFFRWVDECSYAAWDWVVIAYNWCYEGTQPWK